MLKRLLTAVLVLGLIMAFSGTALTAPTDMPGGKDFRSIKKTGVPTVGEVSVLHRTPINPVAPEARQAVPQHPPMPAPMSADTTTCDITNYADFVDGFYNPWTRRSNHVNTELAERFDGPNAPGFGIMVNGVHAWILRVNEGAVPDGLCNVTVHVYNDLAGLPGTEVYSETFGLPVHGNIGTYTSMLFTNPPVVYGSYHISMGLDLTGPSTDTVVFTSDDAGFPPANPDPGTGRSSRKDAGVWMSFYDYYLAVPGAEGFNPDFDWYADWCQVYSSCRTELGDNYDGSNTSVYGMPTLYGDGHIRNGIGQRFVTDGGPDTVKTIDIIHYDFNNGSYSGTSTNGLIIKFWHDDGAGDIDLAAGPIASFTLPGGVYLFPNTNAAAVGYNEYIFTPPTPVIVNGAWHYTIQASTDVATSGKFFFNGAAPGTHVGGSVRFVSTIPPSPEWLRTGERGAALFVNGEIAWLTLVELCKDEFALCNTAATYFDVTTGYYGGIPGSGYSRRAWAMKINGTGLTTRIDRFRASLGDETVFGGVPEDNGTPEVDLTIRAGVAGAPGPVLYSQHFTEAQLTYFPGWTEVVIPGGLQVGPGDFFVCAELAPPTTTSDYIYFMAEAPAATLYNGGVWQISNADGLWHARTEFSDAVNGLFEVEYCSIPPSRWTCASPTDFMNAGADYARTLHTNVALEDAYCDLSYKWKYVDPQYNVADGRISNSGPVVFDSIVVCGFSDSYRFFRLSDGALLGTISGPGAPYYLPSTGINCTPTIAMVTVGGTPKPIMFVGHGNSAGFRVFDAYDLSSWSGTAPTAIPAQLWSVNQTNYAAKGYTFSLSAHIGATNFTNPIVMTLGGTECVIFNTNDQYIWAAEAATGIRYTGWAGPIIVNGLTYKGLATDGTRLFITNAALLPTFPLGDITCWNAATGANIWKLSTSGGLQGAGDMPDYGNETFVSGLALYKDQEVYVVSTTPEVDDPSGQYGGLLYRINANNGAVLSTTPTEHRRQDGGLSVIGALMVDAATIILPGSSRWATSVSGGQLFGYNRFTGGLNWVVSEGAFDADAGHVHDGLLTCEAGDTDLGFITNTSGYLSCFNPVTGDEYFSRRFNNAANVGGALGISASGELLVADRQGSLFCLSKNDLLGNPVADRPRLEILDHTPQGNTYGPLPSVIVTIPGVYYNSGCATLTGTVTFSTTPNGSLLGPVAGSSARSRDIADQLTEGSSKLMLMTRPDPSSEEYATSVASRPALNRSASATPPFFNSATLPINLSPGDTGDFVIDVHQSLVFRGENVFYGYFSTNDPDYFLDSLILEPQVRGLMVGGCLLDTARLLFGSGGTNWQDVLNVPRYGHWGDDDADNWYMEIGGDHDDFYGGFEVYGVSKERIAMNTQDWWTGNGEARAYKALQADPNTCNSNCKPALLSAQTFGLITADGAAYTPLVGNMVCATFLDSVQVWAPIDTSSPSGYGAWNWNTTWLTAGTYNSDSTIGLLTQRRSIGFTGFPAAFPFLGQVVVDFNKIYFRYPGHGPLAGWRAGEFIDYDIGQDTVLHYPTFAAYSTAALVAALPGSRTTGTWGTMKLPYGGGCNSDVYPTLRNAISMDGNQSMNEQTQRGNAYLDSVYTLMGRPAGVYSQGPMRTAPGDQRSHDTWINHDFTGDADTLHFAIAHFGNPTLANPYDVNSMVAPLSKMLNQWVGMSRGDVNNDGALNLADIIYLADYAAYGSATAAHPGPIPFVTVGDVDTDGSVGNADVTYLIDYYFHYGPCPMSKYVEPFTW